MTIEFQAVKFQTGHEAIQWTEADRLAAAGIEFAYLCDHEMPDGKHYIATVPVN